jgi:putative tryptophan/tyrosine transport system substrate-binding protein
MKRRKFITLLGGTVIAWPLAVRAQQPSMPVIGWLSSGSRDTDDAVRLPPFRRGLNETGRLCRRSQCCDRISPGRRSDRAIASTRRRFGWPPGIAHLGGGQPGLRFGSEISDHINSDCLHERSRSRTARLGCEPQPAGWERNGVTTVSAELEAKRLGLLRELVPSATSIAVLVNPTRPGLDVQLAQAQQAARVLGLPLHILRASSEPDLDAAFVTLVQLRAGALMITADGLFADRIDQIAALARRYSVPAMFQFREFAAAGGLMSYGPGFGPPYQQAGILAGRILKGEKPADLPVMQLDSRARHQHEECQGAGD